MNNISTNKLPAPTWTWLNVNEHKVAVPENVIKAESSSEDIPEEVKVGKVDFSSICLGDIELGAGEEFRKYSHVAKTGGNSYTVSSGVKVAEPLRITYDYSENESAEECKLSRVAVVLGDESELTLVITYKGNPGFAASDIRIKAAKNAKLTLVEVFQLDDASTFIGSIGGRYLDKSGLKLIQLTTGSAKIGLACSADLDGYKSWLDIDTGYLVDKDGTLDINYVARHRGKLTDSKIGVSGVLRDRAEKTFRGTIDFIKGCKDATGDEREDVLLMNEGVHNNTVPLILCAEEDVEGAHGASIGKISDEILFYLQARGIPEDEINELMAKSRIDAVAGRIPDEVTRNMLLSED
ncbi:MAG: SufD family Fe-S cluster assembly protein [Eubacterium sp.]|nr:SufD family Fe-S cluster assembly protein [Eubacterium sp.]